MARTTMQYDPALEQIVLRLETFQEFGDLVNTLTPILGVMRAVRNQIGGILPSISSELGVIVGNLDDLIIEVGEAPSSSFDMAAFSEEARRILTEAGTIVEERMRQRFPDLPISITAEESMPAEESALSQ